MPVELPSEFHIFHRPELPVDVFSVVVRRLVAIMHKESMFQTLVRPLLLFRTDLNFAQIPYGGCYDAFATSVIVQKCRCGFSVLSVLMQGLDIFHSASVQVYEVKYLRTKFRCL